MNRSELFRKFFLMETTPAENDEIRAAALVFLAEQQRAMTNRAEWQEKVVKPAVRIFAKLSIPNYQLQPDAVKEIALRQIVELRNAATEKSDQVAQLILLEIRNRFERANIHPPAGFPYFDWVEVQKK